MKFLIKSKLIVVLSFLVLSFGLLLTNIAFAQAQPTPCPDTRASSSDINSSTCVECQLFDRCPDANGSPQGGIDLTRFFPKFSLNDIFGTIATILLAVIVIFFIFKIIIAGFKWVNNDAQDKSKKEAIKSITNGVVGITIAFAAYFIVIFTRAVFGLGGTEQLVNCSNIYFQYYTPINNASSTSGSSIDTYSATPEIFQRCIKLSGKEDKVKTNFSNFKSNVNTNCASYFSKPTSGGTPPVTADNAVVKDRQKLSDCFIKEVNNLP